MSTEQRLAAVASRLEAVAARLEAGGVVFNGDGGDAPVQQGGPACVVAFQQLMDGPLKEFLDASNGIGGVTAESAAKVKDAFEAIGEFNAMSTVCKKPSANELATVFAPLSSAIKAVTGIRKPKDRKDPANLFLDGINGGIGGLGFVAATEKSWEVVQQNIEIWRFVGDKILMQYRKEGPQEYVDWQAKYQNLLVALKQFAKDNHPNGLAWQPAHSGKDVSQYTPGEVSVNATPQRVSPQRQPRNVPNAPPPSGGAAAAWQNIVDGKLAEFAKLSSEVGDEIAEMAGHYVAAYGAVTELIKKASVCKKPSGDAFMAVLGDLQKEIKATAGVKPPKRSSPLDLHWKCVKSSVGSLGFVAASEKSWDVVQAALEEMEFNGNKLLMQFRKSGPELYVQWHGSLKELLSQTKAFAQQEAPTGLKWDLSGMDVSEYKADPRAQKATDDSTSSGGKGGKGKGKGSGGPMKSAFELKCEREGLDPVKEMQRIKEENARNRAAAEARGPQESVQDALFRELNELGQGGGSMKEKLGLKKAKKGTATERKVIDSRKKKSNTTSAAKKTKTRFPLFEGYEGTDLLKLAYCYGTRSQKERKTLAIENERKDAVLIMECEDVNIEIVGVCKNISIAGCKRFNVELQGSIGQVEVSNCGSGYITVNGKIYQLSCDKCEGLEVTLKEEAYNAKIVSSMCSSLNIALDNPDKDAEMELLTLAVPTQYETRLVIDGTKADLVTEAVSHNFG